MSERDIQDCRQGGLGGSHAIVIGASTTGLVAAAAAARHFATVTVLERDVLPGQPAWRKGVPQGRHVHSLLKGGQNVLNHYFPGLTSDMVASGSVEVDLGQDVVWHHAGGWKRRFPSGVRMQCQSKACLEHYVRQRLLAWPSVRLRDGTAVNGLLHRTGRIAGVQLADGSALEADLVIDASGRSSRTPQHLEQLGLPSPPVNELPVDIGYASQIFRPGPEARDWRGMLIHSRPPATRTAALMPLEGGRWIVTLVGWNGDLPGGEMDAFIEWARGLPVPDLYRAICRAEPLDRVWRWKFLSNLRRHYERVPTLPDGLVVVGDANTSLNPIYAQGMSQGAIGANLLDACLYQQRKLAGCGQLTGLSARFHRRYAQFIDTCWLTSTAEDYGALGKRRRQAWHTSWLARYLHRFTELTWHDESAARAFLDVMNLQRPPFSLLTPALLWSALFGPRRPPPSTAPALTAAGDAMTR